MSGLNKSWYAVYTKPRWEKKVHDLLQKKGFESYCPTNRIRRQWSDRLKWVEEPLFKSYVFVKVSEEEAAAVRWVDGIVNFVYWLGKPAQVKDKEIELIRKFLNDYQEVHAERIDVLADMNVAIRKGALMDKEGKVIKVLKNKVQVIIYSLGYSLTAIVEKTNVSVIKK
jgi:transcription antitermination factor NusG